MDLTKMTGEELATLLTQQYQLLIQTQQNLLALNQELERRKQQQEKKVKSDVPSGK